MKYLNKYSIILFTNLLNFGSVFAEPLSSNIDNNKMEQIFNIPQEISSILSELRNKPSWQKELKNDHNKPKITSNAHQLDVYRLPRREQVRESNIIKLQESTVSLLASRLIPSNWTQVFKNGLDFKVKNVMRFFTASAQGPSYTIITDHMRINKGSVILTSLAPCYSCLSGKSQMEPVYKVVPIKTPKIHSNKDGQSFLESITDLNTNIVPITQKGRLSMNYIIQGQDGNLKITKNSAENTFQYYFKKPIYGSSTITYMRMKETIHTIAFNYQRHDESTEKFIYEKSLYNSSYSATYLNNLLDQKFKFTALFSERLFLDKVVCSIFITLE